MKNIQRYDAQYGAVIDGDPPQPHLLQWPTGMAVLYSDYVKDVNARLESAAMIAEQQEELAGGVTYAPDKIRDLKVKL